MEVSGVEMALMSAEEAEFDEVIVLGLKYDDGVVRIHTSMDYQPDIYFTLQTAARLMLEQGGPLND